MKKLKNNEQGLIPILLTILAIVIGIIYIAFQRVAQSQ